MLDADCLMGGDSIPVMGHSKFSRTTSPGPSPCLLALIHTMGRAVHTIQ